MKATTPYFSILVVNYNTEAFIKRLLSDLKQQTLICDNLEIIIVNNVQNDNLSQMVNDNNFQAVLNINLLNSPTNLGFGRAMNLAATHATGEHFLITNPDIRIANSHFLANLYQALQANQTYGVATCQILDNNNVDTSEFYHYGFNQSLGYKGQICWFYGCFLAIRKNIFEQLGGFDKDFFMYCEDIDICYRIKQMGLPFYKINELQVFHSANASEPNKNYDYYYRINRSRFLFAYKHYPTELFNKILIEQQRKAKQNILKYKLLGLVRPLTDKRAVKYLKWQVINDIIKAYYTNPKSLYYFENPRINA